MQTTRLYCGTYECLASAAATQHGTAPTQPVQAPDHDPRYTGLLPNIGQNKRRLTAAHGTMTPPPGTVTAGPAGLPSHRTHRSGRRDTLQLTALKAVVVVTGEWWWMEHLPLPL